LIGTDVRSSGKRMLEEYRYDALGRRVWVSSDQGCAPNNDLSCVTDGVTRTIWDGSDEVAEIRAPLGASAELNASWPVQSPAAAGDPNPFYGRVVYGPGLTVDEPMSVTRYEYRDFPLGGSTATWPTYTLMPFWDYRGTPVYGVFSDGATALPLTPGGTACANHGTTSANRCVALAWKFSLDAYRQEINVLPIQSWHGSVLANKKDGSGLHYMRNRVYDPGTGRFTQEDPIGLAGGLNLYGYANGDPVNFSDPFGLCPPKDNNFTDCPGFFTAVGAATGAALGGFGGGTGGAVACTPGGPLLVACGAAAGTAGFVSGGIAGARIGAAADATILLLKGEGAEIGRAITEVMGAAFNTATNRRCVGDYLEECKESGDRGTKNSRGDFKWSELLEKVREFFNKPNP
jgi:RHS repeat-associated protein